MQPQDARIQKILGQLQVYQKIAEQDYNVPPAQARPIASRPDIAFRPKCEQLDYVWEPEQTAWVWQGTIIYRVPGQVTATEETYVDLQASGICLIGPEAEDVPLVATEEVFSQFEQALLGEEVAATAGMNQGQAAVFQPSINWGWMVLAPLPLVGIGIGIVILTRLVNSTQEY